MTRPRIGITVDYVAGKPHYWQPYSYCDAVERAGGLPIMLPFRTDEALIGEYLDELDGVLLSGGDDLNPALYGEDWHANAQRIEPMRQSFELALLSEVERRRMPVLGVCLGSQLMNVHRGGSLIQFLPDIERPNAFEHRRLDDWTRRHGVALDPSCRIAKELGKTSLLVNTSHKQAVNRVGRGLVVTARSDDGVIEGTEDPSLPFYIGVQWHPERQIDEPEQLRLFQMLVHASAVK